MHLSKGSAARWLAVLVLVVFLSPMRAAESEEELRKQALKLNEITGEGPMTGQIITLLDQPAETKKLLALAGKMAKEKNQPFNVNATYILARTAHRLKDIDTSVQFYKLFRTQAAELGSGTKLVQAYTGMIELYAQNRKFDESEKLCREFLELPNNQQIRSRKVAVLQRMIQIMARGGKTEEAMKLVDNLLKAAEGDWQVLELKGYVQREAGDYDKAAKTYEDVLDKIKNEKDLKEDVKEELVNEVRYILSGVYVDLKQIDKCSEQLKKLLEKDPDNATYCNDLGYIWADHDMNLDEAEKLIRKALDEDRKQRRKANPDIKPDQDKDNAAYLDSLGWVLFKQKKYKEAKDFLQQAVDGGEEGQHLEIYDHLGDALLALGQKSEAVAAWKKGLECPPASRRDAQRKTEVEKKIKSAEEK
jgi:tetratricopeptide (TPR) repeat protein